MNCSNTMHVFTEEKMGDQPYCDCGKVKNDFHPDFKTKTPKAPLLCRLGWHKYTYWYPVDSLLNWAKTEIHYCLRCGVEE